MIRIAVHLLDEPSDVLVSETEHELVTRRDIDGELMEAFAMVDGTKLPVAIEPRVLDAWLDKENAEALTP